LKGWRIGPHCEKSSSALIAGYVHLGGAAERGAREDLIWIFGAIEPLHAHLGVKRLGAHGLEELQGCERGESIRPIITLGAPAQIAHSL
jgi:hypothetical protein